MAKSLRWKPVASVLLTALITVGMASRATADDASASDQQANLSDSGVYVKVQLSSPAKISKLKTGDVVEGNLSRDVYSADHKVFPAGSRVRLTVDHLGKRKRTPNDHWPWVVNVFTPRHENYPVFKSATVSMGGSDHPMQVALISVSRMREVRAKAKKSKPGTPSTDGAVEVSASNGKKPAVSTLVLEAFGIENSATTADGADRTASSENAAVPEIIPAGTHCRILLLGGVSASKSKPGDVLQARLLEPVSLNSQVVLPAGSLFEGKVVKKTPPRWLSRAGSLYLTFTQVTLPAGTRLPIAASLAGAELDAASHTRMDAEGQLRGERPGKAWMAINLGMTAGVAKEVDDGIQLVIEAIVSTATDASTAGTARIVSSCASGLYMATRHGRDVVLPRFTEMEISMDRPVSLHADTLSETHATVAAGGK